MRESVTEIGGGAGAGAAYGQAMGKVWAISERPVTLADNPENGRVRALLATSRTPPQSEINAALNGGAGGASQGGSRSRTSGSGSARGGGSTAMVVRSGGGGGGSAAGGVINRIGTWRKSALYAARPVTPAPPLVASPGGAAGFPGGLMARDVGKVLPLPELGVQPYSDRRELLCLTGAGLQVLTKLRPIDLLHDLLSRDDVDGVRGAGRGGVYKPVCLRIF